LSQLTFRWDNMKQRDIKGLFTINLKGGDINVLRHFSGGPDQAAYLINNTIKSMQGREPSSFDMHDFAAAFVCVSRNAAQANYKVTGKYRDGGVQLVAPNDPYQHLVRGVDWHYLLSKPYRALHIEVVQVLWEERSRSFIQIYNGLFGDYHKHIDGIMQNLEESKK